MENFFCFREKDTIYYAVDFSFLGSNVDEVAFMI